MATELLIRMNCFNIKYNFISLFLLININTAIADQCPTAEVVKERKISRQYDWAIDERRSLEDVLAVEMLYSVRIKNRGEFVACSYSGDQHLLRLDGAALKENCLIKKTSGNWHVAENGEQICKEKDLSLCKYEIFCEKPD